MRRAFRVQRAKSGGLRRLAGVMSWGALLLLTPQSGATDVCSLTGTALQTEVEKGTAGIAEAYAATTPSKGLFLNGKASSGSPIERACNWTCSSGPAPAALTHLFAFLQYNCSSTTALPGTRLPAGPGTASQMGLSIADAKYGEEADRIFRSGRPASATSCAHRRRWTCFRSSAT